MRYAVDLMQGVSRDGSLTFTYTEVKMPTREEVEQETITRVRSQ